MASTMESVMSGKPVEMPDFLGRRNRFHYLTALNLLESMGIPLEDVRVRAMGEYENYRGEVRSQSPAPGAPLPPGTVITLEVGCRSAVDFFPYQFFYGLKGIRDGDGTWEAASRSLLAPFDAAAIRRAAATRMQTLRYDFGIADAEHIRRFMKLFQYESDANEGDAAKRAFIAAVLPSLHLWGGNPEAVKIVLRKLFGYDVRLGENVKSSTPIPENIRYRLGSKTGRLGSDTVIGGSFEERDTRYEVVFADVPPSEVRDLLPGGRTRRMVEAFLDFCTPGELDRTITIRVERRAARAGREWRLGYSTYL